MAYPYPDQNTTRTNSTTRQNNLRDDINAHASALNDLKALLGSNPKGTAADLTVRLGDMLSDIVDLQNDLTDIGDLNQILHGTGAPGGGLGKNGDFYIKTDAPMKIFGPKASGSWGSGVSLQGADGPAGPAGADGADGADGNDGVGIEVETGGTVGQFLRLKDDDPVTAEWKTIHQVPAGGTNNQVLAKASNADHDVEWVDAGGGGGSLPDPSAEPDGNVLTVASGAAVWATPSGGGGGGTASAGVIAFLPSTVRNTRYSAHRTVVPAAGVEAGENIFYASSYLSLGDLNISYRPTNQAAGACSVLQPMVMHHLGGTGANTFIGFVQADVPVFASYSMGVREIRSGTPTATNITDAWYGYIEPFVHDDHVWIFTNNPGGGQRAWRRTLLGGPTSYTALAVDSKAPQSGSGQPVGNGSVTWGTYRPGTLQCLVRLGTGATTWQIASDWSERPQDYWFYDVGMNGRVFGVNARTSGAVFKLFTASPLETTVSEITSWLPAGISMPNIVTGIGVVDNVMVLAVAYKNTAPAVYSAGFIVYNHDTGQSAYYEAPTTDSGSSYETVTGIGPMNGNYSRLMPVRIDDTIYTNVKTIGGSYLYTAAIPVEV